MSSQATENPVLRSRAEGTTGRAEEAPRHELVTPLAAAPVPDRYHITDRNGIEWYLRKLAARQSERALIVAQAEKMLAALDADIATLRGLYHDEAVFVARQELNPSGERWKRKTLDTLHGSISFRDVAAGLRRAVGPDAQTPEALAKAMETGTVVVNIDNAAYLKAAAAALETTGELWPGIERTEARESVSVKFGTK